MKYNLEDVDFSDEPVLSGELILDEKILTLVVEGCYDCVNETYLLDKMQITIRDWETISISLTEQFRPKDKAEYEVTKYLKLPEEFNYFDYISVFKATDNIITLEGSAKGHGWLTYTITNATVEIINID